MKSYQEIKNCKKTMYYISKDIVVIVVWGVDMLETQERR